MIHSYIHMGSHWNMLHSEQIVMGDISPNCAQLPANKPVHEAAKLEARLYFA